MKKLLFILALSAIIAGSSFAGILNLSGRAGTYTIPGGLGTSMMYGLSAIQNITDNLSVRAALDTTSYTAGASTVTYMPITVDIIYGQYVTPFLRPYAGIGASYNSINNNGASTQTTGGQAEVGFNFDLGLLSAGAEYRYLIADLNHTDRGASNVTAFVSGALTQSIGF